MRDCFFRRPSFLFPSLNLPSCLCKALCSQILHLQLSSPSFESVRWQLGTLKSSRGSGQQGFQVVGGQLQVIVTGETKKERGSLACPCLDCFCKYSCFLSSLTLHLTLSLQFQSFLLCWSSRLAFIGSIQLRFISVYFGCSRCCMPCTRWLNVLFCEPGIFTCPSRFFFFLALHLLFFFFP